MKGSNQIAFQGWCIDGRTDAVAVWIREYRLIAIGCPGGFSIHFSTEELVSGAFGYLRLRHACQIGSTAHLRIGGSFDSVKVDVTGQRLRRAGVIFSEIEKGGWLKNAVAFGEAPTGHGPRCSVVCGRCQ